MLKEGAYGADQTEKVGAFRAERTVKVVSLEPFKLGKMGAFREKWVLLELIELKCNNKELTNLKKGALPRHIPVYGSTPSGRRRHFLKIFKQLFFSQFF